MRGQKEPGPVSLPHGRLDKASLGLHQALKEFQFHFLGFGFSHKESGVIRHP